MRGVADLRLPTCPVCGYRVSLAWARHMYETARDAGAFRGMRFLGLIARCEECSTATHAVVIPYTFTPDEVRAA